MPKRLQALIAILRIPQWIKNFFLFAPLIFSKHLFQAEFVLAEIKAAFVFCLISSAAYIINDIADREIDRQHPVKKNRPLAAGTLSVSVAVVMAAVLTVSWVVMAMAFPVEFLLVALIYFVLNLAYSFGLKHVILVDVFIVASGFMLRVLAGAYSIEVVISSWLVLCTLFVSLFLATSKRRGELVLSQNSEGYEGRAVLKQYTLTTLDHMMSVNAAGMAITYALYTVSERTQTIFNTENLIYTTVFVLFGIFRYLILMNKYPTEDNPVRLLVRDPLMLLNVGAWFLACVVIIYSENIKTMLSAL
ncbi:MAG: decaprenyl-phosphate phosphoribosyltransferase [Ignavibacteriae bacterium]|nr:decaprenyl-phosphate phosphoribosyltransferase [Ignavibacteriota bacterium]